MCRVGWGQLCTFQAEVAAYGKFQKQGKQSLVSSESFRVSSVAGMFDFRWDWRHELRSNLHASLFYFVIFISFKQCSVSGQCLPNSWTSHLVRILSVPPCPFGIAELWSQPHSQNICFPYDPPSLRHWTLNPVISSVHLFFFHHQHTLINSLDSWALLNLRPDLSKPSAELSLAMT